VSVFPYQRALEKSIRDAAVGEGGGRRLSLRRGAQGGRDLERGGHPGRGKRHHLWHCWPQKCEILVHSRSTGRASTLKVL